MFEVGWGTEGFCGFCLSIKSLHVPYICIKVTLETQYTFSKLCAIMYMCQPLHGPHVLLFILHVSGRLKYSSLLAWQGFPGIIGQRS